MAQGFARRGLVVDNVGAVSVTAFGDEVSAADRAALPNCLRWLDLPWSLAIHCGRRTVELQFVVKPVKFPQIQGEHR